MDSPSSTAAMNLAMIDSRELGTKRAATAVPYRRSSEDMREATSSSLRSTLKIAMAAGFQSDASYRRSSCRDVAAGCPTSGSSVAREYA